MHNKGLGFIITTPAILRLMKEEGENIIYFLNKHLNLLNKDDGPGAILFTNTYETKNKTPIKITTEKGHTIISMIWENE